MLGMVTTLIGAVLNIILDPLFIFVFHMEIAGAAAATVLAQLASCLFVLFVLYKKSMPVPLHLRRPELTLVKRILALGFSPFLILATDSIIIIAMNAVLQYHGGPGYGDTLITCATIVQSYMMLITSPMLGITGGSQPLISFNYGANKPERIRKIILCVLLLCIGFTTFMFLVSRFLPAAFAGIFTDNAEYIELSVWGIRAFTMMIIPLSFQYVFVDSLTALGMTSLSLFLSLFRKTTYFAATCLLPLAFTAASAFYAEPDCRRNRRPFIICCFYPGVFQISAGNRQACADRNGERKSCCLTCGWYRINSTKKEALRNPYCKNIADSAGLFHPMLLYQEADTSILRLIPKPFHKLSCLHRILRYGILQRCMDIRLYPPS